MDRAPVSSKELRALAARRVKLGLSQEQVGWRMAPSKALRRALAARRVKLGLSQEQVGWRMARSQSAMSYMEGRNNALTVEVLAQWAEALDMRMNITFYEIGEPRD